MLLVDLGDNDLNHNISFFRDAIKMTQTKLAAQDFIIYKLLNDKLFPYFGTL